jgi:Txe/YoeB family toxin of toxin-antitoxin system
MYSIKLIKQAQKDIENLKSGGLFEKATELINIIANNPYQPPYKKLTGDYKGAYSRRINRQHRLVYEIYEQEKVIKILKLWSHYE